MDVQWTADRLIENDSRSLVVRFPPPPPTRVWITGCLNGKSHAHCNFRASGSQKVKDTNGQLSDALRSLCLLFGLTLPPEVTHYIETISPRNIFSQYSSSGNTCLEVIYVRDNYTVEKHADIFIWDLWEAINSAQGSTVND